MKKRLSLLLLLQILLLLIAVKTPGAADFFNDTFTDISQVDMAGTTAEVDTGNGWVALSRVSRANAVLLYPDSYDVTLINDNRVETYRFNGAKMILDPSGSIGGGFREAIAVAGQEGEYLVLDRGEKIAVWYAFDGSKMTPDWTRSISALSDPRALDVFAGTYDFALLDGKSVKGYFFDGTGLTPNWFIDYSVGSSGNALGISLADGNFPENGELSCVVLDKAGPEIRCNSFNGSEMAPDPSRSVRLDGAAVNLKSVSVSREGDTYFLAVGNEIKAFSYDGNGMVYNPFLSVQGLNTPLAVSNKPGSYEYTVLQYDDAGLPMLSYYSFDGSCMVELPALRITGLSPVPYGNDQLLIGKATAAANQVSGLKLTAETQIPDGTSIVWEVSVDGVNWQPITNHGPAVKFPSRGNQPNYRAVLHTDNNSVTPKIFSVRLSDASLEIRNLCITAVVGPPIPGNPGLPTSRKVKIWAGYNVTFTIETYGAAESVTAHFTAGSENIFLSSSAGDLIPAHPTANYDNTWTGTFHTNAYLSPGTLLDGGFIARKGIDEARVIYPGFAEIFGSALSNHPIHLTH